MRSQVGQRKPNPISYLPRATHFITHSYTDYSLVNKWWHYGHEIASHSITHRNDQKYWENMSEEEFAAEAIGQRRITGQFAALDPCEIKGALSDCSQYQRPSRMALAIPPGKW